MKRILEEDLELSASLAEHGADPSNLASHTFRKAAATHASSATTNGPTETAIDFRAGWSRGTGARETYMKGHAGADGTLGRFLAGLPLDSEDFAFLPPHFAPGLDVVKKAVQLAYPGHPQLSPAVAEMLTASLVYHFEFLCKTLPERHEVFSSPLFSTPGLLDELRQAVRCGARDTELMHATGIPGHVALIRATKELQRTTERFGAKIDNLAPLVVEKVGELLEDRAAENGVVTRHGLEELLRATLSEALAGAALPVGAVQVEGHAADVSQQPVAGRGPVTQLHQWGGGLHRVPQSFQLPTGTPRHMWNMWWLGDGVHHYPPLRQLEPSDMPSKNEKKRLSDLKVVSFFFFFFFLFFCLTLPNESRSCGSWRTLSRLRGIG